ncbi:3-hydroxyacyl-CoA dehydrogenase family protein [Rhodococcus sp. NPDC019627]|uniref:3-hydroxyacyl-CoA dehydrogenase n=1 Tax=Rhodococcus opacus (strain B4) TaxID=632772 RepID=C1BDW2_RHOOB|nr:3-hydroxyacyl-CoA dehydrogenase family protein [Rhodococcus opacus]BAH47165.1 3-hydroxyacyl-CoA dehydrogenase [Rhodococcus opacus B4]
MSELQNVAVMGYGTMGAGIAQLIAQSGRTVRILEAEQDRLDAGRRSVEEFTATGVRRGKLSEDQREQLLGRLHGTTQVSDLSDCDLVIEAVTERKDVKQDLFEAVSEHVPTTTLIVTNTSALSITELARSVEAPERFAGLHFFNPAPLMSVVEVVHALQTSDTAVTALSEFVTSLGKAPVVVKDRPGFLVNFLLMPYLNDVVQAYDDALATAEDIDTALKLGLGYKLGPLELLDMIGLDVHNHATHSAYEATLDPRFAPPPLLRQMVAAGRHGTKTTSGFRTQDGTY